jgi:hypothetical protein
MTEEKNHDAATTEQFRQAAGKEREKRAVPVRLPSGLTAMLVKPTPLEILLRTGRVPQSFAARISPGEKNPLLTAGDWLKLSGQMVELVRFIFYAPRVPDECVPGLDIPISDIEWSLRWSNGEVEAAQPASPDLAEFSEGAADSGPTGGALRPAPERPA